MSGNKTQPSDKDVRKFLSTIEHNRRAEDSRTMFELMNRVTNIKPILWGLPENPNIIGYGHYHYKYESGREGDHFLTGFSPRKAALSVYIMPGFKRYEKQLLALGPHKHSVSCLCLTNLSKNKLEPLEQMIADSVERMKQMYDWKAS